MSFDVGAGSYGRFMGRFSEPLAAEFARVADLEPGQRALDVGCGPGALTAVLATRLGVDAVSAVDPSEPFVVAVRDRLPGLDVVRGAAEDLPHPDQRFDRTLAQLVVHFMADPVAGLAEMARVTRADGLVAACVWDHAGGSGPLAAFWASAQDTDPGVRDESGLAGARAGDLARLCASAGLRDVKESSLTVTVPFAGFDEWWEPFTLGVGPAGAYVSGLDEAGRDRLRDRCADRLPAGPFEVSASAWCVRARPGGR